MKHPELDKSTKNIVRGILKLYSDLTYGGFTIGDYRKSLEERAAETHRARREMLTPCALDQFRRARDWLDEQPRTRRINHRAGSSYSLKEEVEVELDGRYVSDGMFIAAAIACGYQVERAGFNSRHAWLNIGQARLTNPNLYLTTSKRDPPGQPRYFPRGERLSNPGLR